MRHLLAAALFLCACSGDDTTIPNQPGPPPAGPGDATVDDTGAAQDSAPPPDTYVPPPPDAGDDSGNACSAMATRADCTKCCNDTYPAGVKTLLQAELACACAPAVCDGDAGVIDAGDDAGDAGSELGTNACAATCDADAGLDPTCRKCLNEAVGNQKNQGPCYKDVQKACTGDCAALVACTASCPKK